MDEQFNSDVQSVAPVGQQPKNVWKIVALVIAGILILGGVSYGVYYWWQNYKGGKVCTQDAKQCPDGSYVSRTGPNCEFAACPATSSLEPYYQDLAEKCKEKDSPDCCLSSVDNMASGGYKLAENGNCPAGYKMNGLECIDTYTWCEPEVAACAKEGEGVRASGVDFPARCCSGLKAMYGYAQEDCSAPGIPGDIGTCSKCGNGVCEPQNNENKCNCPQDCSSNSTADWQTYRNVEYGFEINLTDAWKGYRVVKKLQPGSSSIYRLYFEVPTSDKTWMDGYGYASPMAIDIYPISEWQKVGSEILKFVSYPWRVVLNNDYAFHFVPVWQDTPSDLENVDFGIGQILSTFKFTQ